MGPNNTIALKIGMQGRQRFHEGRVHQALRLEDRYAGGGGQGLDRGVQHLMAPAAGAIRLRHDACHDVTRSQQRLESGDREVGRAEEHEAQRGRR